MCRLVGCVIWGAHTASGVCNLGVHVGVRVLTPRVVPSRGAVCAVVAIRDRVFRLELTFSQKMRGSGHSGPCVSFRADLFAIARGRG